MWYNSIEDGKQQNNVRQNYITLRYRVNSSYSRKVYVGLEINRYGKTNGKF